MNLYTLIFKKESEGQEYKEVFKAINDPAARTAADDILEDHPNIDSYELYKSGDKIIYTRDGE